MANVFLSGEKRDVETAILLEQAYQHDIGNAVAYTDGDRVFINTDDNLYNILPAYNHDMLKWLLWHERYHNELRHHNRFFRYLKELDEKKTEDEFQLTKQEVNIIMDILVHDSLSKLFPELIETAKVNLAQMRNNNSLKYNFKTFTLEEMLNEYKSHKKEESDKEKSGGEDEDKDKKSKKPTKPTDDGKSKSKGHKAGGSTSDDTDTSEHKDGTEKDIPDKKDETDWSKLEKIDDKEFITTDEADGYIDTINKLKAQKLRLGKLTETLNGLATTTRQRTYAMPSTIRLSGGAVLKGSKPGRTRLYLCFDASGSMGRELAIFKEIISKAIPQAMDTPCEWFAGVRASIEPYKTECGDGYFKGKFKDIMPVYASSGFNDDGDRTIELCWQAEQQGYSPIGITDGGGQLDWSKDKLKQLKRTILVGQNKKWLEKVRNVNPSVKTLDI